MTCKDFIEQLLDFTGDDLGAEAQRLCEEHADLCRQCADYLESYQTTVAVGRGALSSPGEWGEDLEGDLTEELVQSVLAVARTSR